MESILDAINEGLFQGVINLVLLTVANKVSSWLTGSGLW